MNPRASVGLLILAAIVAMLHTLVGCGSAAQGSLSAQTLPNVATVNVIACDGGTVHFGGDLWLDARSGSATTDSAQQGQHIASQVEGRATVTSSAEGNATAAPAADEDSPAPIESDEAQPGAAP